MSRQFGGAGVWGPSQTTRERSCTQTRQQQLPTVGAHGAEPMISTTPYVPGKKLVGPGTAPVRRKGQNTYGRAGRGMGESGIWGEVGKGTTKDPLVGWLFDVAADNRISAQMRQDHVEVARSVARRHGFACILIRKEAHMQQYTYTVYGTRNTVVRDGRIVNELEPADDHMTVYMGPSSAVAHVAGHIYVVRDRSAGCMKQMDHPATQRSVVLPGQEKVAEEFWLTKDTWFCSEHSNPFQGLFFRST